MTEFFDFICYSIYKVYYNGNESGAEFSAACTLALLQSFNIFIPIILLGIIKGEFYLTKAIGLSTFGVFVVVNYIRYIIKVQFGMEKIKARWDAKTDKYHKDSKFFQSLYVIVSLLGFVSLVTYMGLKKTFNL